MESTKLIKEVVERVVKIEKVAGVSLVLTIEEAAALFTLVGNVNATNMFIGNMACAVYFKLKGCGFTCPNIHHTIDSHQIFGGLDIKDCKVPQ